MEFLYPFEDEFYKSNVVRWRNWLDAVLSDTNKRSDDKENRNNIKGYSCNWSRSFDLGMV